MADKLASETLTF